MPNINIKTLKCPVSFERYVKDGGWCAFPFLQLTVAMVEFWTARGFQFKFSRIGPVMFKGEERLFLITTGYTPPSRYNMPLKDRATSYIHCIDLDGNPIFQGYYRHQETFVEWANKYFSDVLEQFPPTQEELNKLHNAIEFGNAGNIGQIPFINQQEV